jgi:hypothetical protein
MRRCARVAHPSPRDPRTPNYRPGPTRRAQYERYRLEQQAQIEAHGQTVCRSLVFVRQTIGNACGTIGLIHSVCNNAHRVSLGTATPVSVSPCWQG